MNFFTSNRCQQSAQITEVNPVVGGLPEGYSLSSARIYDHLSPRMQVVLKKS